MTIHRPNAMDQQEDESAGSIADRLKELLGNQTFAQISRATGCNSETVRRYMHGGTPSVTFLIAVARHYSASPTWLLLGQGPKDLARGREPKAPEQNGHAFPPPLTPARDSRPGTNGAALGVVVCAPGVGGTMQDNTRG